MPLPTIVNRAALLVSPGSPLVVRHVEKKPKPGPYQLLIAVSAVAVNPSDWRLQESEKTKQLPCVLGSDVAGFVEEVGSSLPNNRIRKGDRVGAFAGGAWTGKIEEGAFQDFVLVQECNTFHAPDHLPLQEAATIPMAVATAAAAIWSTLALERPAHTSAQPRTESQGILIYGASSAVGLFAVQIAKSIGMTVFAVASEKHEAYIRKFGADYIFYREHGGALIEQMKRVSDNIATPIDVGFDTISLSDSLPIASEVLARCAKVSRPKLAITLNWPDSLPPSDLVTVERTSASHFHLREENARWLFHVYLPEALAAGAIKPAPPIRLIKGGLEAVQEAIDICKRGMSCEKVVVAM